MNYTLHVKTLENTNDLKQRAFSQAQGVVVGLAFSYFVQDLCL